MNAEYPLEGRVAMVTGASRGIGAAIARELSARGADLVITARTVDRLGHTVRQVEAFRRRVLPLELDIRRLDRIEGAIEKAVGEMGRIDILVNNAGTNLPSPVLDVDVQNWEEIFQVNVRGGFFVARGVASGMIERGWGRIIFISSQSGASVIPGQTVYCASKAAVNHLARCLGIELGDKGITVNAVAPTFVETEMTRKRLENPNYLNFVLGKIPAGKIATAEDVAAAVAFLSSDEAGMINASVLAVDGGWTAW